MGRHSDSEETPGESTDLEPTHLWVLGLAIDDNDEFVGPGRRQSLGWPECNCPDDCLRDHENE